MNRLIPEGFLHSRFTGEQLNHSLLHFLTGINFLKPESLLFANISGLDEEVDAIKTETPVSSTSSAIGLNPPALCLVSCLSVAVTDITSWRHSFRFRKLLGKGINIPITKTNGYVFNGESGEEHHFGLFH